MDQHGILRGKALPLTALESAFRNGVTMTSTLLLKDTSHRTVFPVWTDDAGFGDGVLTGAGDVIMRPDPETFRILPWSAHSAWMLADIEMADGAPFPFSPRHLLRQAIARLAERNMALVVGLELEFHVFRITDAHLGNGDTGMPPVPPETELLAHGYQYLTEDRYDQLEPVMDALRHAAEGLGLPVRSMEVEFGPGQFEFTFDPADALTQADNMVLFRTMAEQVCRRQGLHATFMTRPQVPNGMASGWHLHQSLTDRMSGQNLFMARPDGELSAIASAWIAGLLDHAHATCPLSTPTINGYKRYQNAFQLAPDRIAWGRDKKGTMLRALMGPNDPASRVKSRLAEAAANPYLHMASQISAGLDGIVRGLAAPDPVTTPYESTAPLLPRNLGDALTVFAQSEFVDTAFGDGFTNYFATIKRAEWDRFLATVTDWEKREYFSIF
ncbi:MAG: glutamine synthetase family protein [Minwuia sp.]|nr:glutamine synthetase family protein [Minwuia sp.]